MDLKELKDQRFNYLNYCFN